MLPQLSVSGAATAFGLASLLPLNVPAHKPFMYCNGVEVAQTQILFNNKIYSCGDNNAIMVSCPRTFKSAIFDECPNIMMECDVAESLDSLYCSKATLFSHLASMCNSTTVLNGTNSNETSTVLNCYPGALPESLASFIPTTTTTERPTEENHSFGAIMYGFYVKLFGQSDTKEDYDECDYKVCDPDPQLVAQEKQTRWIPEALTIPPKPTTFTTTESSAFNHENIIFEANDRSSSNGGIPFIQKLKNGSYYSEGKVLSAKNYKELLDLVARRRLAKPKLKPTKTTQKDELNGDTETERTTERMPTAFPTSD